jgi:uncharacterized RDD family membrane protein YckC
MQKYYKILGLDSGATKEEIQIAYNRLSVELDPANNNNFSFFQVEYNNMKEAYEILIEKLNTIDSNDHHKLILNKINETHPDPDSGTNNYEFRVNKDHNQHILSTNNLNCPKCTSEIITGAKFCLNCGYNIKTEFVDHLICKKCYKSFSTGSKFCDIDGSELISNSILMPKCINCGIEYSPETKFCPVDGGTVILGSLNNNKPQTESTSVYSKASLGKRFIASIIDSFICMVLSIPALIFLVIGNSKISVFNNDSTPYFILSVIFCFVPFSYSFVKDGIYKGQSLGKKSVGLIVIHLVDNTPCTYGKSFLRNLMLILINLIPLIGWLVEPIMVLVSEDGRRLGDKAANTQVIEKKYFNN